MVLVAEILDEHTDWGIL